MHTFIWKERNLQQKQQTKPDWIFLWSDLRERWGRERGNLLYFCQSFIRYSLQCHWPCPNRRQGRGLALLVGFFLIQGHDQHLLSTRWWYYRTTQTLSTMTGPCLPPRDLCLHWTSQLCLPWPFPLFSHFGKKKTQLITVNHPSETLSVKKTIPLAICIWHIFGCRD